MYNRTNYNCQQYQQKTTQIMRNYGWRHNPTTQLEVF